MDVRNIIWIGHASFRVDDAKGRIYIDPWKVPDGQPSADLVLITHSHFDHLSPEDIRKISGPNTIVAGPKSVVDALGGKTRTMDPGAAVKLGAWTVEAVPAYNIAKEFHKQSEGWVGYIITLSDGRRLYHAGDTDATDELRSVKADIALMPCGGTYTMTASDVVAVANVLKPQVLIPMHWGDIVGTREDAETVREGYPGTVIVEPLRPPATP